MSNRYIEPIVWYGGGIFSDKPRKRVRLPAPTISRELHAQKKLKEIAKKEAREEARRLFAEYRKDPIGIYADFCDWMVAEHYGHTPSA